MSDTPYSAYNENARLLEFANYAISHYTREQFDRNKSELTPYNVSSTHGYDQSHRLGAQTNAATQRDEQQNLDRIDRLDAEERKRRLRVAASESRFGRNHAEELHRLLQTHEAAFGELLETTWRNFYHRQCEVIRRNIATV